MQIVVIGDVGSLEGNIHIGDEAMFQVFVEELGRRGADTIVGLSSQPADTSSRYGISSIRNLGFTYRSAADRHACMERMDRIIRTADGEGGLLDAADPANAVIEAVRVSDGVGIAGGGNISTLWSMHVFERATLGAVARVFRVPLVVSGQTIGPLLSEPDSILVRELLSGAAMVGVREADSHDLLTTLGVASELTVDDASFLGLAAGGVTTGGVNYCLVTVANHVGVADRAEVVRGYAALLDHVAKSTGLEIVFSAHFGSLDAAKGRGDSLIHEEVAALMATKSHVVPPVDPIRSAELAHGAALVISSRYHPVVFAVAGGVPAIGVYVDDYTEVKLKGALGNFGQTSAVSVMHLVEGRAPSVVDGVWENRDAIRRAGLELAAEKRSLASRWWDRVAAQFGA